MMKMMKILLFDDVNVMKEINSIDIRIIMLIFY